MSLEVHDRYAKANVKITSLASETSSEEAVPANPGRRYMIFTNTDANPVFIKFGSGDATAAEPTLQLAAGANSPVIEGFTGRVAAIWGTAGTGALVTTEW